jgi:hypothetical protein
MSHLARGPILMGIDSKTSRAGRRHLGLMPPDTGTEAAR